MKRLIGGVFCVVISLCGGLLGIKLSGIAMNIYCQLGVLPLLFATGTGVKG